MGITLAYCEPFLTLAAVFRRFDMELFETTLDDIKMVKDMSGSKGVRIRILGERNYAS